MCIVTFGWEMTDAIKKFERFKKTKSLGWATIELIDNCNHRCIYCYANSGSNPKPTYMSKKDSERLIQILANAGVKQITCSGGEPLMYPYIEDFVKNAGDHGIIVHMNTNGYFLTRELANRLAKYGLTQIQINIDSLDPKKHDYIRGKKGSFRRTIQAFKNAWEVGLTCVKQTVVTKLNEGEVFDIIKFARSIGVQRCRTWDLTPSKGRAGETIDLRPTNYLDMLKKLTKLACKNGAKNIESCDPVFPLDFKTNLNVTGGFCVNTTGLMLNVTPEGDVPFCCTQRESLYNIFIAADNGENIAEYHKSKIEEYVQSIQSILPLKCKETCNFFKKCMGGCYTRVMHTLPHEDYVCPKLNNCQRNGHLE